MMLKKHSIWIGGGGGGDRRCCRYNIHLNSTFLLYIFLFIVSFLVSSHECHRRWTKRTTEIFDNSSQIKSEDDDESQWSDWSEWSPCSRSCDGGISMSIRKCMSKAECIGNVERYKICNMQPCSEPLDFRAKQCSMYNSKPYRDRYYEWLPYIDPTDPCSLTCKAKTLNFVTRLAATVKDGTRCRLGSLDMCVAGKCLSVGCDLQLGSLAKIDDCGICGGDGTSCKKYHYTWSHRYLTECSRPCGGGVQVSNVTCLNDETSAVVDDIFCNGNDKLPPESRSCNEFDCPPSWVTTDWSKCDRKCATGRHTRRVFCAIEHVDGTQRQVPEHECTEPKPDVEMPCNTQECPQWYEGEWSECSEGCGNGVQIRPVVCRDSFGFSSDLCEIELKPIDRRNCSNISNCLQSKLNSQEDSPQLKPSNEVASSEPHFIVGQWSPCNVSCGLGRRHRTVECKIELEFSKTVVTIPESQCTDEKPHDTESCYGNDCIDDQSQLDLKYINSEELVKSQLSNVKLSYQQLNETSSIRVVHYGWRVVGFSNCSHRCLGGTQETVFECIRDRDNATVDSINCRSQTKPDTYTRTCNDHPCLPRWNVTDFSECSKECGGDGYQTRIVRCVHEVARGSTNVVVIPDNQCKEPMPETRQKCNEFDCPAKWMAGLWSKCSKECGGGMKTRAIRCMKELASGVLVETSMFECSMKKPKLVKMCNLKQCPILRNESGYHELPRKSKRNNQIMFARHNPHLMTINVEGKATVVEGSTIKLRCQHRLEDEALRPRARWSKRNQLIDNVKRFHASRNILKIRQVQPEDSAVYKCWFGEEAPHSMFLHVVPKQNQMNVVDQMNIPLNDHQHIEPLQKKKYYKSELDLSQEVNTYERKQPETTSYFTVNTGNRQTNEHLDDIEDSYEVTHSSGTRSSTRPMLSTTLNEVINSETKKMKKNKKKKKQPINQLMMVNDPDLKFDWIITEWSRCTIKCGGIGFRMRLIQCFVQVNNLTQAVSNSFCTDRGLEQPKLVEKCGMNECESINTFWKTGQWSECDNCVSHHRGTQSRSVNCLLSNGTIVNDEQCQSSLDQLKPAESQQCVNINCIAHWLPGRWSQCNSNEYRSRSVQCIWKATNKPAHASQCDLEVKPEIVEKCFHSSI